MPQASKIKISDPAPAPIAAGRWRTDWRAFGAFSVREVFTSPDGVEYVRAFTGRVDLEVPMKTPGLAPLKLRRLDAGKANLPSYEKDATA